MNAAKFTAADVVVGATVHLTSTSADGVIEEHWRGEITGLAPFRFTFKGGRTLYAPQGWTVEILDVVPPKPKYVTGGIYRVTSRHGSSCMWQRHEGGWGDASSEHRSWSDAWLVDHGYTVGDRVLVINYPSDHIKPTIRIDADRLNPAALLVVNALREESDRGVTS